MPGPSALPSLRVPTSSLAPSQPLIYLCSPPRPPTRILTHSSDPPQSTSPPPAHTHTGRPATQISTYPHTHPASNHQHPLAHYSSVHPTASPPGHPRTRTYTRQPPPTPRFHVSACLPNPQPARPGSQLASITSQPPDHPSTYSMTTRSWWLGRAGPVPPGYRHPRDPHAVPALSVPSRSIPLANRCEPARGNHDREAALVTGPRCRSRRGSKRHPVCTVSVVTK